MSEDFLTSAFVKMRTVLKGTASRLLGNEAAADDALQEAFYKLWNRHYVLASESDAAALLSRTVRNEAVDTLRQRKRHPQVRIDSTDKPWNDGYHFGDKPWNDENAVEKSVSAVADEDATPEREEMLRNVKTLIESQLTPIQQEILQRRDYNGEEYASIAEDLGMQETAVRMQLSRARKTIRETYRKQQRNYE